MLSREKIFDLAEPFGEFQYGDAQGDKRVAFARAVEAAAYERAAQECEKRAGPIEIYNRAYPHYLECADAIRALGEQHD